MTSYYKSLHQGFVLPETQTLLALCQELGWVVNPHKSDLELNQVLIFIGLQYNLFQAVVRPTTARWLAVKFKDEGPHSKTCLFSMTTCVSQKSAYCHGEAVHMRSTQWHLNNLNACVLGLWRKMFLFPGVSTFRVSFGHTAIF